MSQTESPASPPAATVPAEAIDRFIARYETRQEDWEVFAFQEQADPRYRRSQMRYVGGGGTEKHDDPNTLPPGHFTLSILTLPPGHGGPMHYHETEEVFFVLEGEVTCQWQAPDGRIYERTLKKYDAILNPPGVPHCFWNKTDQPARFNIMVGAARPKPPVYTDPKIEELRRQARAQGK
jgi:oxalate decarboxylase/phosphoglucose isomerase-like protein (cupin superfamily)